MAALRSKTVSFVVPAIVIVAAIVLVVAAQLGDGRDGTVRSQPMPQASPTAEPTVTPTEEVTELDPEELRVTSYEVFLSRDPFEPVHPALAGDPGGGDGGGGGTNSPTTSPTSPGTGPTTGPTTNPTTGPTTSPTTGPTTSPSPTGTNSPSPGNNGCTQNATVVCDGQAVSVIDVYTDDGGDGAVLQVDNVLYDVRDGELFAASFRVMSVDAPCVTLLYGDDAFTICEGESVLK